MRFTEKVIRKAAAPMVVVLCEDGDELEIAWSNLMGKGCDPDEIYSAEKAYFTHRKVCMLCHVEAIRKDGKVC